MKHFQIVIVKELGPLDPTPFFYDAIRKQTQNRPFSLSHKTSIQTEFRYLNRETGDLPLRFDPNLIFDTLRQEERARSARLGFHHAFTPNSDLIASFIYRDEDFDTEFTDPSFTFDLKERENGYMGELQHLFRHERFSMISGAGHFDSDLEETETIVSLSFPTRTIQRFDIRHTNFYLYSQIMYPENVTWTLGGSADFLEGRITERDQLNSKFWINVECASRDDISCGRIQEFNEDTGIEPNNRAHPGSGVQSIIRFEYRLESVFSTHRGLSYGWYRPLLIREGILETLPWRPLNLEKISFGYLMPLSDIGCLSAGDLSPLRRKTCLMKSSGFRIRILQTRSLFRNDWFFLVSRWRSRRLKFFIISYRKGGGCTGYEVE